MKPLKYKVIKDKTRYKEYCELLNDLKARKPVKKKAKEHMELLSLLTEKWESGHPSFSGKDPVVVLRSIMKENNLLSKDLVTLLGVSKGLVSDILNYKKGFSKEIIRTLSTHFKVSQEAFNQPYRWNKGSKELTYS